MQPQACWALRRCLICAAAAAAAAAVIQMGVLYATRYKVCNPTDMCCCCCCCCCLLLQVCVLDAKRYKEAAPSNAATGLLGFEALLNVCCCCCCRYSGVCALRNALQSLQPHQHVLLLLLLLSFTTGVCA
jgi:hypothetical protein